MKLDYDNDIKIDESNLAVEWLDQPRLMMKYSKHIADMKKEVDLQKEKIDLIRAEYDTKIRKDPKKFKLDKISNEAINNIIIQKEKYREANEKLIELNYEYNVAMNAVRAFEQRKSALENLVKLHGQQYFAGPSIPFDLSKEWEKRENRKEANKKIKIKKGKKNV